MLHFLGTILLDHPVVVGEDQSDAEDPHAHDRQLGGLPAEEHLADAVHWYRHMMMPLFSKFCLLLTAMM